LASTLGAGLQLVARRQAVAAGVGLEGIQATTGPPAADLTRCARDAAAATVRHVTAGPRARGPAAPLTAPRVAAGAVAARTDAVATGLPFCTARAAGSAARRIAHEVRARALAALLGRAARLTTRAAIRLVLVEHRAGAVAAVTVVPARPAVLIAIAFAATTDAGLAAAAALAAITAVVVVGEHVDAVASATPLAGATDDATTGARPPAAGLSRGALDSAGATRRLVGGEVDRSAVAAGPAVRRGAVDPVAVVVATVAWVLHAGSDVSVTVVAVVRNRASAGRQYTVAVGVEPLVDQPVAVVVAAVADLGRARVDGRIVVVAVVARDDPVSVLVRVAGDALPPRADVPGVLAGHAFARVGRAAGTVPADRASRTADPDAGGIAGVHHARIARRVVRSATSRASQREKEEEGEVTSPQHGSERITEGRSQSRGQPGDSAHSPPR